MKDAEVKLEEKITPTSAGNTTDEHNNGSRIEWDFEEAEQGDKIAREESNRINVWL